MLKLATVHPANPPRSTPALAALEAHRQELAEVAAADSEWAAKEATELAHVAACGRAQSELSTLEQRRIDAQADHDVLGRSDIDTATLAKQIATAREAADALVERGRLAEAKVVRIKQQRDVLRQQRLKLATETAPLVHAARLERLGEAMATLVEAEAAYVRALEEAFGVAATVDEIARGTALASAGHLDLAELWLQRPAHPAFANRPSPLRADIAQAITAVAEQVAKEL